MINKLTEQGAEVLVKRCSLRDTEGNPTETPDDIFRRVADFIGTNESERDTFCKLMSDLDFLPNSPTLSNSGKDLANLSACFVLPIEDNMESIFQAVKEAALIHKQGGGTGFSFSNIRPKGTIVASTRGEASGPVSFLRVFNEATEAVNQGGVRRGANMAVLRVDHPDILEFIECKSDTSKLTKFNISVAITDEFMKAYEQVLDTDYKLSNGKFLDANEVMNAIVEQAHKTGEPGIVFIDEINRHNPYDEDIESTNPCGEQPLPPYGCCNLGSINLLNMYDEGYSINDYINWRKFRKVIECSVKFLNRVIDKGLYPLPQIKETVEKYRPIGLGVMGFADLLYKSRIPYNSEEARRLATRIMEFMKGQAWSYADNNTTLTSIAPTGTLSMIAGVSAGIEPNFGLVYQKHVMDKTFTYTNPIYEEAIASNIPADRKVFVTAHDISPTDHVLMQAAWQEHVDSSISKTINLPADATEQDILDVILLAYEKKCKGLTVYRDGCRKNVLTTGTGKVKEKDTEVSEPKSITGLTVSTPIFNRSRQLQGRTFKTGTSEGTAYITINHDEYLTPIEVFTTLGKAGGNAAAWAEAVSRLVSLGLQNNIEASYIANQLIGIKGSQPVYSDRKAILSTPDAIGQALREVAENEQETLSDKQEEIWDDIFKEENTSVDEEDMGDDWPDNFTDEIDRVVDDTITDSIIADQYEMCPHCNAKLLMQEGCLNCSSCGYSKCN